MRVLRERLSVCVCVSFSFCFKCGMWDFIVDVPDHYLSGPGCSKLTTSLVNVSLNFQKLISQICQYFLSKKFYSTKISVYLVI